MKRYYAVREILRTIIDYNGLRTCLEQYVLSNQKIVIYGASEIGNLLVKQCLKEKIELYGICDKKVCKDGWSYLGYPIISINTLRRLENTIVIIASVGFEKEIKESLINYGIDTVVTIEEVFRK